MGLEPDSSKPPTTKSTYHLELERLTIKWVKLLRLTSWDWEVEIGTEENLSKDSNAEVTVDDEDSSFIIRFQPLLMLDGKKLEALVVHELCHVLIHRVLPDVQSKANLREEERLVNSLVKIFMKLHGGQ